MKYERISSAAIGIPSKGLLAIFNMLRCPPRVDPDRCSDQVSETALIYNGGDSTFNAMRVRLWLTSEVPDVPIEVRSSSTPGHSWG